MKFVLAIDSFKGSLTNAQMNEILEKFECEYCEEAFEKEHAIEVLLPIIQHQYDWFLYQ